MKNFQEVIWSAKQLKNQKTALVAAEDKEAIKALIHAKQEGLCDFILIGEKEKIKSVLEAENLRNDEEIIEAPDHQASAFKAIELIKQKKAQVLMKGKIKTGLLMKCVLDKQKGIPTGEILSHILAAKLNSLDNFLLVSDGGMIIAPSLEEKESIIKNAIKSAQSLKINNIKVGILASLGKLVYGNKAAAEAAILSRTFLQNQKVRDLSKKQHLFKNIEIIGPVDLDEALRLKANILIAPDIETGNIFGKSLMYFAGADSGLIIAGAQVPIIVTSRSDNAQTKLNSIALALSVANAN